MLVFKLRDITYPLDIQKDGEIMKLFRFGVLFLCLVLSFSFLHTAAAENGQIEHSIEEYAAQLSEYTALSFYKGENAARYIDFKTKYPDCSWETIITDVNIGLDTPYYTNAAEIENPGSVDVLINKYNYLPAGFVPDDLETVDSAYCFTTLMLTHDARVAFEQMCADARALGYTLYATSGYRSYRWQQQLYSSYGIPDITTARPGYSEHQTGLAVDVIHHAGSNSSLAQSAVYDWYAENAHKYGFIIRYQDKWSFITGYDDEPWHLRYLGTELATAVKNSYLSYDEYYTRYINTDKIIDSEGMDDAVGLSATAEVTINGTTYSLSAFRALDTTYYKLRDIAVIVNGTDFEFDVTWDAEAKLIRLLTGVPYSAALLLSDFESGQITHMTATRPPLITSDDLYMIGAFMVEGSNYYTLESLSGLLGFTVSAGEEDSILLDTSPDNLEDDSL